MCKTQAYLGAQTPFGIITFVENRLYNPKVTLRSKDGSEMVRRLPELQALGVKPVDQLLIKIGR